MIFPEDNFPIFRCLAQ